MCVYVCVICIWAGCVCMCVCVVSACWKAMANQSDHRLYVSDFQSFMVLSFSNAADAMMFSVGWQAVQRTVSVCPCSFCTTSLLCRFQI